MTKIRAISGKGLAALLCSVLLLSQPVLGSPGVSISGPISSGDLRPDAGTPSSSEASSTASQSIAVAKLTGTADRNGQPLLNGSIVSSGDLLSTHEDSALLLASTPQERLWLGPNTSAKLTKDGGNLAISLERGTLGFRSWGHIEVTFSKHDGVALKTRPDALVLGQLSLLKNQEAQVRLQAGSLVLTQGSQSILLQPEGLRPTSNADPRRPLRQDPTQSTAGQETPLPQPGMGSIKGNVVDSQSFIVRDANITLTDASGKTFKTTSDAEGNFQFSELPVGTYTLHVVHPGFQTYDLPDVVVRSGNESTLFVQLGGAGAKKSNALLIGLVVAGGAAAGIGVYLGTKGKSTTSPSQ